jgi:hypothetical protein
MTSSVHFVQSPPRTVYIPPRGFHGKTIVCSTNAAANITWIVDDDFLKQNLDPIAFNITRVNDTTSTMYLTAEFVFSNKERSFALLDKELFCKTGTNETSNDFTFDRGVLERPDAGKPTNKTVTEGKDALLVCSYDTKAVVPPPSSVMWRFISTNGNDFELLNETDSDVKGSTVIRELHLKSVNRTDAGIYQCVIKNEFGTVYSTPAVLTIQYFDGITVTVSPDHVARFGTNMALKVRVLSTSSATEIRLTRRDGPFFSTTNKSLNRNLGLVTVTKPDYMEYNFTADLNWNGTLSVFVSHPLGTDIKSRRITVEAEKPGSIHVSLESICSNPSLIVNWILAHNGGSEIKSYTLRWNSGSVSGNLIETNAKTLRVSDYPSLTQQRGNYTITELKRGTVYNIQIEATNDIGSTISGVVSKTTFSRPGIPNLTATSIAEKSIRISWTMGGHGGEISTYKLMWSTAATFAGKTERYNTLTLPLSSQNVTQQNGAWTIFNLSKNTEYYVRLTASNCLGSSNSSVQRYSTRCNPGRPSHLMATVSKNNEVNLTLQAPSERDCGLIMDYIVRRNASEKLISSFSVINGSVEIIITGLVAETQYTVRVSARNNLWEGSPSDPLMFETSKVNEKKITSDDDASISTVAIIVAIVVVSILIIAIALKCCCMKKKKQMKGAMK